MKHRHPNDPAGYVRFYCRPHLLEVQQRATPADARTNRAPARTERRAPAQRTVASSDKVRAMCPDCYVEISATGVCGMCGRRVG